VYLQGSTGADGRYTLLLIHYTCLLSSHDVIINVLLCTTSTAPAAGTALPSAAPIATTDTTSSSATADATATATASAVDDCTAASAAATAAAVADCVACKQCAAASTSKGRGTEVVYNVDTLCYYLLHTGDFCEPTTRLPFTLAQVVELEELAGRAGIYTPIV
jgi:hypothetical protein